MRAGIETEVADFVNGPLDPGWASALRALWHSAHGNWRAAHEDAQTDEGHANAWVHAMLHREEGDQSNAAYWYRLAGKPVCGKPIQQERDQIIATLLRSES